MIETDPPDPIAWFGLAPDADERAIKRAYARRLKDARPDEDPAAFQLLHQMYRDALEWCAVQACIYDLGPMSEAEGFEAPALEMPTVGLEAEAAFDWNAFYDDFLMHARRPHVEGLRSWLDANPMLWSLERKAFVGTTLFEILEVQRPPLPADAFDSARDFFAAEASAVDFMTLHQLRSRLDLEWRLQPGNAHLLSAYDTNVYGDPNAYEAKCQLDAVSEPFSWTRNLVRGLQPGRSARLWSFLLRLNAGDLDLPPPIRPEQVAFWKAANDRARFSIPRLAIGATQCIVYSLLALPLLLLLNLGAGSSFARVAAWEVKLIGGVLGLYFICIVSLAGVGAYLRWQGTPEVEDSRPPLPRLAWIPLLAAAAFACEAAGWSPAFHVVAALAYITAWWRFVRRMPWPMPNVIAWCWLTMTVPLAYPAVAAMLALLLWAADAIVHWRALRLR